MLAYYDFYRYAWNAKSQLQQTFLKIVTYHVFITLNIP